MKEAVTRSLVKKKSSSGCLIIKKKKKDSSSESSDSASPYRTKKRGLDVFEFDEYDRFDHNNHRIRNDSSSSRYKWNRSTHRMGSGNRRTTSRHSYANATRFHDDDDDESDLPLSVLRKKYRSSSGKAIRLQGKNGVLKVMVNHNKQTRVSHSTYDHDVARNKFPIHMDSKHDGKPVPVKSKEKSQSRGEPEGVVKEAGGIKGKVKCSSGTEKQILREMIKNMLVGAGWTIDYRPRRNRAYLDAVYISPSGTGYWSIVKAYDAFQKEEEDNFTPLADEILAKLTRQTQKKTEREMQFKRKSEEEDEKLSSYGRKSRKIGRCSLLVREAETGDGFVPYSGKRTLLSWLIDSGVVSLREHVGYMNRRKTRMLQKGWIAKDGIHCGCCSKIVTVLKFEAHAGSKLGHPFPNIFLESGKSLMQCQIDAWNKLGELERKGFYTVDADGEDPNDDTCGLCGDGGDLICCDGCPSTFHQTCLNLPTVPQGDWFCPNCSCKYCDIACTNSAQASLLTCYLCQKKYHESCRPEIDVKPIESNYPNLSFCGHTCHELYSQLQKLVGVKHELDSGFSWSLIHRSEISLDAPSVQLSQRVECNSMLAVAMSVMEECFLPFTDRRSGINLIRNVVFNCGSNLSRLNYSSFFTAILERGDEVVCAASIRVHGTRLAEMPFIGTRHIYRRQGMCRRLLSAIEVALSSLQVEKLIIPAVPEHMDTWTDVFGFHPLEESDKQELRCLNMVVFPRTDMLQKPLAKTDSGSHKCAGAETPPIKSPCEPEPSGSADAQPEPSVDESTVRVADEASVEPQLLEMASVSTSPPSNSNLKETDVQSVVSLDNNVASDAHRESVSLEDASIAVAAGVKESSDSDAEKDLNAEP